MSTTKTTQQTTRCQCGCGGQPVKGRFLPGHNRIDRTPLYVVEPTSGCWIWQRAIHDTGYGKWPGVNRGAHRVMYERSHGVIPDGHHIHHRCRNRACVNPAHLEALPPREHGQAHRLGTCKAGAHELTPANVYVTPDGRRNCRACRTLSVRNYRARVAA